MYAQAHKPVRKMRTAEGHAVRANYMYSAMADLAYEYQDKELQQACRNYRIIWCTKECILQEVLDLLDSWNDLQQIMICQMTAIILRHVLMIALKVMFKREWQIWRRMLLIWM